MTVLNFKKPVNQFWYEYSPFPTPLGIAVHLGWLNGVPSTDGIAIKSIQAQDLPEDPEQREEYIVTHAFRQGSSIPAIWARSRGADTRVIGLSWTDESQKILTHPHSDISRVKDLRGLRLAVPNRPNDPINMFRATALRGFLSALELDGLSANDVEFVSIDTRPKFLYVDEVDALLQNKVDAIYVRGAPGVEIAKQHNLKEIIDIGFHPDPHVRMNNGTPRPLTVHNDVLENFPDIVAGFLQLVASAGVWTQSHEEECVAFIAHQTACLPESVRSAYGINLHNNLHVDFSSTSITALKNFKDFLFQSKVIPNNFDIDDWIDPQPLQSIQKLPKLKRG